MAIRPLMLNLPTLLLAVILLNQTDGRRAIPVIDELIRRFAKPEDLIQAERTQVKEMVKSLRFGARRTETLIRLATSFMADPPRKHIYHPTRNYPDRDELEIAHLYGIGLYAYDCWRILCLDVFRGYATDHDGGGNAHNPDFRPEWTFVRPRDKGLRAYITWETAI